MKEIILGIVVIGLFIFFFYFLISLNKKKKEVKEVNKEESKGDSKKDNEKLEMPEILKEVTRGNYMHEVSMSNVNDLNKVEMEENLNIKKDELDSIDKIENAFDEISDMSLDLDLGDEIVDDSLEEIDEETEYIDDYFNDTMMNNIESQNKNSKDAGKTIADEYKGLSNNMKALIIANVLSKKNK